MSRAREFADLAGAADAGGLTGKNMVVNGAMTISQRGTSTTSTSDGYHTVDRLYFETNQLDNYAHTMSQSTEAPAGFANSFKIDVTTAETSIETSEFLRVMYRIEAQDCQRLAFGTSSAQKTTLSFYVRSAVTGTYAVSMYQFDGNRIIGGTYTINSADTWERKTITFDGDTSGVINNDNGAGLQLSFMLSSGSDFTSSDNTSWSAYTAAKLGYGHTANVAGSASNDWHITGVQLEVGEQATPFDHSESYGETLARCKRYFERFERQRPGAGSAGTTSLWAGPARSGASNVQGPMHYVEKRNNPTISVSSAGHLNAIYPISPFNAALSGFGIDGNAGTQSAYINATGSGSPGSDCASFVYIGNAAGYLDIDAEL